MKPTLLVLGAALAAAVAATAVDVPLRDGTVIEADSYRVTGSYVMIFLADGSQVAFDVVDVDVSALRTAEAAASAEERVDLEEQQTSDALSSGRSLKSAGATGDEQPSGLTITDHDVKHRPGSGVRGQDEQQQADVSGGDGPESGYQVGGSVVLNNVKISPAGEGQWQIQGEVVNRDPQPIRNVIVKLETIPSAGEEKWSGQVSVSSFLGPDEKATFEHGFAAEVAEGQPRPSIRASVLWMREESRREPDYTETGGVPPPGNSRSRYGTVTGADPRPTLRQ